MPIARMDSVVVEAARRQICMSDRKVFTGETGLDMDVTMTPCLPSRNHLKWLSILQKCIITDHKGPLNTDSFKCFCSLWSRSSCQACAQHKPKERQTHLDF